MFHKEDSSILSKKKKSVDTHLKKSVRREIRKIAGDLFAADASADVLNAVFLEGTLVSRKIAHDKLGGKVELYYRSPSSSTDEDEASLWPYRTTTQCVWISVDLGPSQTIHAPTVALLSILPNLFPTVVVPTQVSKFLCRGAHLMRAGILQMPPTAAKDDIVCVQVHGNPQPFAVGRVTPNTTAHSIGANVKGVGVEIWTCLGDDLWKQQAQQANTTSTDGVMNPIGGACFDNGNYGNIGFLEGKVVRPIVAVDSGDDEESKETDETCLGVAAAAESQTVDNNTAAGDDTEQDEPSSNETTSDTGGETVDSDVNPHDVVLHQAVCHAVVNIKDSDLPMTTANLYAQHVLPNCPPDTTIQLKSTSWKKFGPYLKQQQDAGLLSTKPVGYLVEINRKHDDLRGIKKTKSEASQKTKLAVVNLYMIPHHFVSLLRLDKEAVKGATAKSEERLGTGMLTVPECRAILDEYIAKNELNISSSEVQLDGALTDALYKKHESPPTRLSRKDLNQKWIDRMEPAYALVEMPGSRIVKLGRGKPPQVLIEVSLRQGRKYITRVRNLEDYDIDPVAFTKDVSKRFACSGAVESDPEGRAALKKGRVELVFQGYLVEELRALLLGDEKLTSHGGAKDSPYHLPKAVIHVVLKKGVPAKKPRKKKPRKR